MFRWVDHTAELELEIESPSEAGVFAEALAALAELLDDAGADRTPASRRVAAEARDRPALLASWLEELVFLAESEGFIPEQIEEIELAPGALGSQVRGRLGRPPPLVKAVTYHRLEFAPAGRGYRARVVLDV